MNKGKLIIVNGGSSVGKSSLCKAFQDLAWERLEESWVLLGIDVFWMSLPPRELDLDRVQPEFYTTETWFEDGLEYFIIHPGPLLDQAMYARYRAIQAYLDYGCNVIADDVIWKLEWLEDTVRLLEGYHVTFVGARVSDAEGARREQIRGDRHTGWDRGSQRYAHRGCLYDFELDTTAETPQSAAGKLLAYLQTAARPTAFAQMRARLPLTVGEAQ